LEVRKENYSIDIFSVHSPLFSLNTIGCKEGNSSEFTSISVSGLSQLKSLFTDNGNYICNNLTKKNNCCTNSSKIIIRDNYHLFIDIIKHSQARNTNTGDTELKAFKESYVLNSTLFQNLSISTTYSKVERIGMLPVCEIVSKQKLHGISLNRPLQCNYFKNMVTSMGLCYSFNSLRMNTIFKSSAVVEEWNTVFGSVDSSESKAFISPTNIFLW
jgi:hypothetical protein